MKLAYLTSALCILLICAPAFAAVDNAALDAAAKEYVRLFEESREAGNRPGMADMGDYVDQAFAKIPIDELTLDQIDKVQNAVPAGFSTKTSAAIDAALDKQAKATDVNGARAALLKMRNLMSTAKSNDRLPRYQAALAHPALAEAVAKGYGTDLFATALQLDEKDLPSIRDGLINIKGSINPDAPAKFFTTGAGFLMSVAKPNEPELSRPYAPLREALSTALSQKLKSSVDEKERPRLEQALAQLNGPFIRGELIGAKAPAIDFTWFADPAKPDRSLHSLDDLKGKVVVLDFWATWCGPCVASFPKVKALNNYYRGYDVAVIGVTSLQGFHSGPTGRIDTKGDPQKEYDLMREFVKEKGMTWPVAFSKQPVFNPDYGVMGIPDVVIIDPKGIVRYAGLHPAMKLEEKTAIIDKLLGEAGLMLPATLMMPKKPE